MENMESIENPTPIDVNFSRRNSEVEKPKQNIIKRPKSVPPSRKYAYPKALPQEKRPLSPHPTTLSLFQDPKVPSRKQVKGRSKTPNFQRIRSNKELFENTTIHTNHSILLKDRPKSSASSRPPSMLSRTKEEPVVDNSPEEIEISSNAKPHKIGLGKLINIQLTTTNKEIDKPNINHRFAAPTDIEKVQPWELEHLHANQEYIKSEQIESDTKLSHRKEVMDTKFAKEAAEHIHQIELDESGKVDYCTELLTVIQQSKNKINSESLNKPLPIHFRLNQIKRDIESSTEKQHEFYKQLNEDRQSIFKMFSNEHQMDINTPSTPNYVVDFPKNLPYDIKVPTRGEELVSNYILPKMDESLEQYYLSNKLRKDKVKTMEYTYNQYHEEHQRYLNMISEVKQLSNAFLVTRFDVQELFLNPVQLRKKQQELSDEENLRLGEIDTMLGGNNYSSAKDNLTMEEESRRASEVARQHIAEMRENNGKVKDANEIRIERERMKGIITAVVDQFRYYVRIKREIKVRNIHIRNEKQFYFDHWKRRLLGIKMGKRMIMKRKFIRWKDYCNHIYRSRVIMKETIKRITLHNLKKKCFLMLKRLTIVRQHIRSGDREWNNLQFEYHFPAWNSFYAKYINYRVIKQQSSIAYKQKWKRNVFYAFKKEVKFDISIRQRKKVWELKQSVRLKKRYWKRWNYFIFLVKKERPAKIEFLKPIFHGWRQVLQLKKVEKNVWPVVYKSSLKRVVFWKWRKKYMQTKMLKNATTIKIITQRSDALLSYFLISQNDLQLNLILSFHRMRKYWMARRKLYMFIGKLWKQRKENLLRYYFFRWKLMKHGSRYHLDEVQVPDLQQSFINFDNKYQKMNVRGFQRYRNTQLLSESNHEELKKEYLDFIENADELSGFYIFKNLFYLMAWKRKIDDRHKVMCQMNEHFNDDILEYYKPENLPDLREQKLREARLIISMFSKRQTQEEQYSKVRSADELMILLKFMHKNITKNRKMMKTKIKRDRELTLKYSAKEAALKLAAVSKTFQAVREHTELSSRAKENLARREMAEMLENEKQERLRNKEEVRDINRLHAMIERMKAAGHQDIWDEILGQNPTDDVDGILSKLRGEVDDDEYYVEYDSDNDDDENLSDVSSLSDASTPAIMSTPPLSSSDSTVTSIADSVRDGIQNILDDDNLSLSNSDVSSIRRRSSLLTTGSLNRGDYIQEINEQELEGEVDNENQTTNEKELEEKAIERLENKHLDHIKNDNIDPFTPGSNDDTDASINEFVFDEINEENTKKVEKRIKITKKVEKVVKSVSISSQKETKIVAPDSKTPRDVGIKTRKLSIVDNVETSPKHSKKPLTKKELKKEVQETSIPPKPKVGTTKIKPKITHKKKHSRVKKKRKKDITPRQKLDDIQTPASLHSLKKPIYREPIFSPQATSPPKTFHINTPRTTKSEPPKEKKKATSWKWSSSFGDDKIERNQHETHVFKDIVDKRQKKKKPEMLEDDFHAAIINLGKKLYKNKIDLHFKISQHGEGFKFSGPGMVNKSNPKFDPTLFNELPFHERSQLRLRLKRQQDAAKLAKKREMQEKQLEKAIQMRKFELEKTSSDMIANLNESVANYGNFKPPNIIDGETGFISALEKIMDLNLKKQKKAKSDFVEHLHDIQKDIYPMILSYYEKQQQKILNENSDDFQANLSKELASMKIKLQDMLFDKKNEAHGEVEENSTKLPYVLNTNENEDKYNYFLHSAEPSERPILKEILERKKEHNITKYELEEFYHRLDSLKKKYNNPNTRMFAKQDLEDIRSSLKNRKQNIKKYLETLRLSKLRTNVHRRMSETLDYEEALYSKAEKKNIESSIDQAISSFQQSNDHLDLQLQRIQSILSSNKGLSFSKNDTMKEYASNSLLSESKKYRKSMMKDEKEVKANELPHRSVSSLAKFGPPLSPLSSATFESVQSFSDKQPKKKTRKIRKRTPRSKSVIETQVTLKHPRLQKSSTIIKKKTSKKRKAKSSMAKSDPSKLKSPLYLGTKTNPSFKLYHRRPASSADVRRASAPYITNPASILDDMEYQLVRNHRAVSTTPLSAREKFGTTLPPLSENEIEVARSMGRMSNPIPLKDQEMKDLI